MIGRRSAERGDIASDLTGRASRQVRRRKNAPRFAGEAARVVMRMMQNRAGRLDVRLRTCTESAVQERREREHHLSGGKEKHCRPPE